MKAIVTALFGALLFIMAGCGGSVQAPKTADGGPVTIYLLSDSGIKESMSPEEKSEREALGQWMAQDLARIFGEGGYSVSFISSREEFAPGRNKFMLFFAIVHYRPGRLSTREEAGFGEGVVEIDTYIELFKDNNTIPVLQKKQGSVSGREWQFCAGEVNKQTAPAVSKRINELN